ncbi:hypothetical protein D3Y59_00435 [Hymenobacter oligotrophus]|uniref:Uncharacterized protein n=1 Tax=Hymenobacter oligotrophus TaxID=2319843 RepID=A0A3B7QX20_9BACT|nr:hypothetical protein D3Y59_00435 [Hymenobacter oligotrophus]
MLGCQRGQQDAERNPASTAESVTPAAVEALAREYGPMLRGVWVKEAYMAEIARTRSPLQAAAALQGIAALRINPATRSADSLRVALNLNNHEAGELTVYFRPGAAEKALPTNYRNAEKPDDAFELAYDKRLADTTLLLNRYSKGGRQLASERYVRLQRNPTAAGTEASAVQRFVHQQLLAGTYAATDSAGRRNQVRLGADGSIRGLGRYRSYQAATDFAETHANNLDYVLLDANTPRRRRLAYESTPDTVRLYSLRLQGAELRRGRLLYTLVRPRPTVAAGQKAPLP